MSVVALVTPEIAKALLKGNVGNRPISEKHVAVLARDQSRGAWGFTAEPLIFGKVPGLEAIKREQREGWVRIAIVQGALEARLLDGQHRLTAVVRSGKPQWFSINVGCPQTSFMFMGRGDKRTLSDVLAIDGHVSTKQLASALKWIHFYETEGSRIPLGADEAFVVLSRWPEVPASVRALGSFRGKGSLLRSSIYAALHSLIVRAHDEERANEFIGDLAVGAGLPAGDPVLLLRNTLITTTKDKHVADQSYLFKLAIKAYAARSEGRVLKFLRVREEGPTAEGFPKIPGLTIESEARS